MSKTMQIYATADDFMLMKVNFRREDTLQVLFFICLYESVEYA